MIRRLLLLAGALLLIGAAEPPRKPIILSPEDATREGRALIAEILSLRPQPSTNAGVLSIRMKNKRVEMPVKFRVVVTPTNSLATYQAVNTNQGIAYALCVGHAGTAPNRYANSTLMLSTISGNLFAPNEGCRELSELAEDKTMVPFAGSDFWVADLGLEFFHWPVQNVVRKEINRTRFCRVLESINPKPAPGGYSKVKSWIDNQSDALVQAEAYDTQGKLLKIFLPKRVKEVEGQWQLQEMQISNVQTGSRTTIEFELGSQGSQ
jgi:hypothetical protein